MSKRSTKISILLSILILILGSYFSLALSYKLNYFYNLSPIENDAIDMPHSIMDNPVIFIVSIVLSLIFCLIGYFKKNKFRRASFIIWLFATSVPIILFCSLTNEDKRMKNPCSLSTEVLQEYYKLDSLISDPITLNRTKIWMKCNYDEPSLFDAEYETYRFQKNCDGGGSRPNTTKIVRIEKLENGYNAVIKEFEGYTGSRDTNGNVTVFELTKEEWDSITNIIDEIEFWTLISEPYRLQLSGCNWSVQGYKPDPDPCTMKNFYGIGNYYPFDSTLTNLYYFFDDLNQE